MATIQATLNITSITATSEPLAIAQTKVITIDNPVQNTSRVVITASTPFVVVPSAKASATYVYLLNADTTNNLDLAEATTNVSFGTLLPGEWALLPVKASVGLEVDAVAATAVLEYGFWSA